MTGEQIAVSEMGENLDDDLGGKEVEHGRAQGCDTRVEDVISI